MMNIWKLAKRTPRPTNAAGERRGIEIVPVNATPRKALILDQVEITAPPCHSV